MTVDLLDRVPIPEAPAGRTGRTLLRRCPMTRLPLGSIQAQGWLGHQLELMRTGMVGRLDELSGFLGPQNGWFGGEEPGWEEQPYWLRGFYPLGILTDDDRIKVEASRWIEAVIRTRQDDGYFGASYHKRVKGDHGGELPDLWPQMVMLDALILYYETTRDKRIPELAEGFFRWCERLPDDQFIPRLAGGEWQSWREEYGTWKIGVQIKRAGDMIPHLHWLYDLTGEAWLLDLATRFYRSVLPPVSEWLDDHVVNFAQRFAYPAIYSRQDDSESGVRQSEYWYGQHMSTWGQQPRGIFGADERIRTGKTDPRQGFETCGMVEFAKQFYHLSRITGLPLYADRAEDVMLNHFPAAQTPDLTGLHYLTAANMPQLDAGEQHDFFNKGRQICYSPHLYRCCQHNVAMGWPWYAQNLWQTTADGGVAAWMYGASEMTSQVGRQAIQATIEQRTDYPFREDVALRVTTMSRETVFPLYLRVPRWCAGFAVFVNGRKVDKEPGPGSVVRIEREWAAGDEIDIEMPMSISRSRWPRNLSVSVDRGPLTYSVRIPEKWQRCGGDDRWPEWEVLPDGPWNFALVADDDIAVAEKRSVVDQPWTVEAAPVELEARAKRVDHWTLDEPATVGAVPGVPVSADARSESIRMIPLGCARLRISCLPEVQ